MGRIIQVKVGGLSPKVFQKASVPQGSNLSSLLILIYVNDPKIHRLRILLNKSGTKPHNHFKDLQTVCNTNIRT